MNNPGDAAKALKAMATNPQNDRLMRLKFPHNNGPKATMVANKLRAREGLSRDFRFDIEILSDDARIPLKTVMGKMVTVELVREDGSLRYFNGYVVKFKLAKTDGGFAHYKMTLGPWLSFLKLRQDCYLFHGKTVQEQTSTILADYNSVADWNIRDLGPDPAMTDAYQFGESDYNYLHRRWEALGWYYYYEHGLDFHRLILCGNSTLALPIDGKSPETRYQRDAGSMEDDAVGDWSPLRQVVSTDVAKSSFDFKNPKPMTVEIPTKNQQGIVPDMEVYKYAGAYGFKSLDEGEAMARREMEEIEHTGKLFKAAGNDRTLQNGRWTRLVGHYDLEGPGTKREDREFLIVEVTHTVTNNYLQAAGSSAEYHNTFTCLRRKIPWRPSKGYNSKEPKIYGVQTAIVVGPKGEEIHTDQYGRVRVQFHWDREGEYDEKSSTWVRVASTWAGSNFGFMAVPRIGQEVIVHFLDGNPDRPIITGRVFNAHNMPPWELPANQTQTGILSRSSTGGGYDNANAIRFEDKKGAEEVWLHAEKDQRIEVEHDESHWVGNDRTKNIDHDETSHIKHDRTETVDNDEKITVHNNRTERVDHNETISIGDNRTEDVGQNETINIGANRSVTIGGNKIETITMAKAESILLAKALSIGLGYQVTVGAAMNTTVALMQSEQVGQSKTVNVGKSYNITAGDELTITVGKAAIKMKSDGTISINGHTLSVGTTGEQTYHADGNITMNGKNIEGN
jgi:type VI secretion system secreted protein VgrG